jgi:transportin-1
MLVPRLLVLFQHPTAELRRLAVGCMNNLMTTMPAALYDNLDRYLNELFTLRNDSSVAVRPCPSHQRHPASS